MTLRIPRDFAHLLEFRKLKEILDRPGLATILFIELWIQLGYSVESTGAAGFLSDLDEWVFQGCNVAEPLRVLESAGFIKKVPGGWECPMFVHYNAELDSSWIPGDTDDSWKLFQNGRAKMQADGAAILGTIPELSWYAPPTREETQGKLDADTIKKCILLVKMVDAILKLGKRAPAEFEPPVIHAALSVIREYSETQISVILRRAFEVSRRKNLPPGFTRSTIVFLDKFEDAVLLLLPADGFIKWGKRKTHAALTE